MTLGLASRFRFTARGEIVISSTRREMEGMSIPRRRGRPSVSVSPPHQQPNPTSACSHPNSLASNGTMVWRPDATSTSASGLNPHLPRQACSVKAPVPPPLVQAGTAPVEKDLENGAVIAGGALSSLLRVRACEREMNGEFAGLRGWALIVSCLLYP